MSRLLAASVLLIVTALPAQQPLRFTSRVDTVEVFATVRGEDGALVSNLTKDDFVLVDNGELREIVTFSDEIKPISVAFVLDRSGSTGAWSSEVTRGAEAFVGKFVEGDRASVMTLTWDCQPMTADHQVLRAMVRASERVNDMGSPIWAALERGLAAVVPDPGRRALVLFSDGDDTGSIAPAVMDMSLRQPGMPCQPVTVQSRATSGHVGRDAALEGVQVYAVGIEGQTARDTQRTLVDIATDSGGEYLPLKNPSRMEQAFTRIADELHHQYSLGFTPRVFDGKEHRIIVRSTRPGLTVRARMRYVADAEASAGSRPSARAAAVVAPPAPLTDDEVKQAIEAGTTGQAVSVTCLARGVFKDRPQDTQTIASVRLEGPFDRIARSAVEAAARGGTLDVSTVTPDMRAPTLQITAQLIQRPAPGEKLLPLDSGSLISAIRVWSEDRRVPALNPVRAVGQNPGSAPMARDRMRVTSTYDLAAFRALPGNAVDIVVYSPHGGRSCQLTSRERDRIR